MHWIRNYTGVLKSATDLRGNLYIDWRGKYIGFEQNLFLHIKKNETLKELLRTKDIDQIKNYCYANMDQRTDEAMISTPYNWDFFSRCEKRLREKLTFPQFHRIPRASTPFILQGRIMLFRGIDIRMPQDISYQIDITGFPVQIGAVGAA